MSIRKRLTYLTGTRADFGLMEPILQEIARSRMLELELIITGMHLSDKYGRTESEVAASGIPVAQRIVVPIDDDSGAAMGISTGLLTVGMANYFANRSCDALLLLGDRGEMLAGATAALFAGVPIVHIAGGDRSGSVDDSMRHAISKLAHVHCVSSADSAQRLIGMGENPSHVHQVGAPGLVGLERLSKVPVSKLARQYGFDAAKPFVVLLFHPVVQDAAEAGTQWAEIFAALVANGFQTLCLLPNADHGTDAIRAAIDRRRDTQDLVVIDHMPRPHFLSAVRGAQLLIGNSSSGIVEAASLGTAVVNVGDRQMGRLRSDNIFDVPCETQAILKAIFAAKECDVSAVTNAYGTVYADHNIRMVLEQTDFANRGLLKKAMPY